MTPLLALNKFLIVLINVAAILLGFFVFKNNPKGRVNTIFAFMVLFMLVWVNFACIPRLIGEANPDLALLLLRVAWFVTPLFFTSLYFLVIYLLEKEKNYRTLSKFVLLFGLLAAFIAGFTDLIVSSIRFVGPDLAINYGPAMLPFLGIISFLTFATLYLLFKEYFKSSASIKLKLQYFLIGILIFYLANIIFNIVLPLLFNIVRFYWVGDYAAIFLLSFTAYAIVKRELFGIRVILTQFLVWVFAILLFAQIFLSSTTFGYVWSISLLIVFFLVGCLLIKELFRGIENQKRIGSLEKRLLEKELDTERKIKEAIMEISEEKQRKLAEWMTRDEFLENMKLKQEILNLATRVKELEKELEGKKVRR